MLFSATMPQVRVAPSRSESLRVAAGLSEPRHVRTVRVARAGPGRPEGVDRSSLRVDPGRYPGPRAAARRLTVTVIVSVTVTVIVAVFVTVFGTVTVTVAVFVTVTVTVIMTVIVTAGRQDHRLPRPSRIEPGPSLPPPPTPAISESP